MLWLRFVCLVNLGFAGGDLVLVGVVALWLRFVLVVLCGIVLDAGWCSGLRLIVLLLSIYV